MVNIKQGDWVKMKADNCLTWTYDIETDSLFIYRNEKYDYETILELNVDVILDLDDKGMPSSFEFLNASKLFKVKASSLNSIKEINVSVSITEKLIELNTELTVLVMDEFSQKYLFNMAANCYSIPEFNEVLSFA